MSEPNVLTTAQVERHRVSRDAGIAEDAILRAGGRVYLPFNGMIARYDPEWLRNAKPGDVPSIYDYIFEVAPTDESA